MARTLADRRAFQSSAAIEFLDGDPRWVEVFAAWAAEDRTLLTPTYFLPEIANRLLRGQGVPPAGIALRLDRIIASGIETADRRFQGILEAIDLADRHGLTVYDALYLQLAVDVHGELATLDKDLIKAAAAEGLAVTKGK